MTIPLVSWSTTRAILHNSSTFSTLAGNRSNNCLRWRCSSSPKPSTSCCPTTLAPSQTAPAMQYGRSKNYNFPDPRVTRDSSRFLASIASKSFSSSSDASPKNQPFDLMKHLTSLGYNEKVSKGMADALETIHGVGKVEESAVENFGEAALQRLAEAVEMELTNSSSSFVGTVHFVVKHHNFSFDLPCKEGESLMMLSKTPLGQELLSEYLICACGGKFIAEISNVEKIDSPSSLKLAVPLQNSANPCASRVNPPINREYVVCNMSRHTG